MMRKKKSDPFAAIAIVVLLGLCGICGKCGLKEPNLGISNQGVPPTVSRSPANLSASNADTTLVPAPKTLSSTPTIKTKAKTATVIIENVGLQKRAGSGGEVIETLPLQTSVEVLKQKGVWFYVAFNKSRGWLHGNTIRLTNETPSSAISSSGMPPTVREVRTAEVTKPERSDETDSSGATAKCRDGTLSYSAHRRGTCSHHGGVAVWY